MRLARTVTVLAAGAAAMWFLERRHMLPGQARPALPWPQPEDPRPQSPDPRPQSPLPRPQSPVPSPQADESNPQSTEPVPVSGKAEPEEEEEVPVEQPTREQPVVPGEDPEPVDVTAVVDDLIAPSAAREGSIVDAEVVPGPPEDEEVAQAVCDEIATVPGIPADAVAVEVTEGTVHLRGTIDSPGTISELDRRVRELEGVDRVRNLLHLPGTPPPD